MWAPPELLKILSVEVDHINHCECANDFTNCIDPFDFIRIFELKLRSDPTHLALPGCILRPDKENLIGN